jgi:hypothetical protein
MHRKALSFVLLMLTTWMPVQAKQDSDNARPAIQALRLQDGEHINMDGRLEEPAWRTAIPATDFRQSDPQNGEAATERSEIRILFGRDTLYIGAEFFDSEPEGMLGNQMVRDGFLASDDRFMWVLDPFNDQRSGYFFEINPSGAMGDSQLVPAQGGSFGVGQNRAWDGIWLARVRRHDEGWTAEIQIPFRTLNFDPEADAWGANFQRTVRRKNEESFWTGWGRNQGLMNLAYAGRIEGIREVSQGVGLDVKPYVIGTAARLPNAATTNWNADAGVDLFYNLTPQLKANLTVNTDFAQTEVDDRQVNLTRFPLLFPEKRDFFLDGAGNFDFAREPSDFNAFFTRRIGLDQRGLPQSIDYGAKLGGAAGAFNLGMLHVRTAEENGVLGEDFTVFRPKRRFMRQSYAGLIYTRRATRDSAIPDRHSIGGDFELATTRFRGSKNLQFSGFFLKTPNGISQRRRQRVRTSIELSQRSLDCADVIQRSSEEPRSAIGFVERRDYRRLNPVVRFGPRPRDSRWVRQVSMETWAEVLTDTRGELIGRSFRFTLLDLNLHSQDSVNIQISPTYERLERDFILGGYQLPKGNEYRYTRYSFGFSSANRRKVSGNVNATAGTFYSGHRRDLSLGLNLRPRRGVLATFTSQFNRIELAEGSFSDEDPAGRYQYAVQSVCIGVEQHSIRFREPCAGMAGAVPLDRETGKRHLLRLAEQLARCRPSFTSLDRSAAAKVSYTVRL